MLTILVGSTVNGSSRWLILGPLQIQPSELIKPFAILEAANLFAHWNLVKTNKITPGHAKILVGLGNSDQIAKKIVKKNLSVRQTENLVRIYKSPTKSIKTSKDPNIKIIEADLMEKIGLKTQITNKKNNKGSVTFDYRDLDQLNHLIEIIKKYY